MARVPKSFRSITFPIVLGVVAEVLTIALLVGWILVIIRNTQLSEQVVGNSWLMFGGIVSFVVIGTVLVLFNVFLVREILEGRRQVRFIDSVTHELKSPLAALKLCVETLERRDLPPDRRHEMHVMMLDDIDRLSSFIDDVLQASRVGYGPGDRAWAEVHLHALADRCVKRVRRRRKHVRRCVQSAREALCARMKRRVKARVKSVAKRGLSASSDTSKCLSSAAKRA